MAGYTFGSAFVYGDSDAGLGDAWMRLESPTINGGDVAKITLYGENTTNPTFPQTQINMRATLVFANGSFALCSTPTI